MPDIHLMGISGSLRSSSFNTALLRAAQELMPEGMGMEIYDLAPIPMYDQDLVKDGKFPEPVEAMRRKMTESDGLMIATPEYNFSVPGVLKNALDWASRPPDSPLEGKPAAIMGATSGNFGTVRAQMHLRQVLLYSNTHTLRKPEVLVMNAAEKFDGNGRLVDETTRDFLRQMLEAYQEWIERLRVK